MHDECATTAAVSFQRVKPPLEVHHVRMGGEAIDCFDIGFQAITPAMNLDVLFTLNQLASERALSLVADDHHGVLRA